jgi:chromosome segregation ATPase
MQYAATFPKIFVLLFCFYDVTCINYVFHIICIQLYAENKLESLEEQARKLKNQADELARNNSDLTNAKNRLSQESAELQRQLHDLESNAGSFSKTKSQLQIQLEETKAKLDEETRVSINANCI